MFAQLAELIELPDSVVYGVGSYTYKVCQPLLDPFDRVLASDGVFAPVMNPINTWATDSTQHPLAKKLPLLSNPSYVLFGLVMYGVALAALYVIGQAIGPKKIKFIANVHNMFLFFLSLYMCLGIAITAVANGFGIWNNPIGSEADPSTWRMAKLIWLFYVSKIPEFGDTMIMMVKHNYRQVSFLHLYHHGTIFAIWYIVSSRAPGGEAYWSAMLNSGVHVVMYGYYWLTAIFPEGTAVRSFLNKIKFYITKMQMLQFFLNCCQSVYDLWIVDCAYPTYLIHTLLWYMCTLLALFGNFLIQNSGKKKSAAGGKKAAAGAAVSAKSGSSNGASTPRRR